MTTYAILPCFFLEIVDDTLLDFEDGVGFESKDDLSEWIAKDITGDFEVNQKEI